MIEMWEYEILKPKEIPSWCNDKNPKIMNDFRAEIWARKGLIKLVRHFKFKTDISKCKSCGQVIRKSRKVYGL